ncbi:Putative B3 domain-containing protein At3g24850 [Linum grandiflorum]
MFVNDFQDGCSKEGGSWYNFQLLADIAVSVSECSDCRHSDPYDCFHAVSKAKKLKRKAAVAASLKFQNIPRRKRTKLFHVQPSSTSDDAISISPPSKTTIPLFSVKPEEPILASPITTVTASPLNIPARFISLAMAAPTTTKSKQKQQQKQGCVPSSLRDAVSGIVGGSEFTLVMQKKVTGTDLSTHHNRLSIPPTKIANQFLTDGEKSELKEHKKIKIGYFVDPDMVISDSNKVSLRRWDMDKGFTYNIIGDAWKTVVEKKQLAAGDDVELWSFRSRSGDLCLALLSLAAADKKEQQVMMIEYGGTSNLARKEKRPLQIMSTDIDLTLKL